MPDTDEPEIQVDEAISIVGGGGWLLDVREVAEWNSMHTPAAHLIPMSEIQSRVDEIPDDTTVYVICHSGARSARVAGYLRSEGLDAVNVAGGMLAWQAAGGQIAASPAT